MAITTFNKYVTISYDTSGYPADTRNRLERTFNDVVIDSNSAFDENQVFVSYNGQRIQQRHTETVGTFAKFYYELDSVPAQPTATISGFAIAVCANTCYALSGYVTSSTISMEIKDDDLFFVDYTYSLDI